MSKLEFFQFPYNWDDNYGVLIHSPDTGETACIDGGIAETYQQALDEKDWKLTHIFVTHHHADHTTGVVELKETNNAKVIGPSYVGARPIKGIDESVSDGDRFEFAGVEVQVIHTPGHTMDLICYYIPSEGVIFVGDTLFALGCGKAFEGTPEMIWESLKKLHALPPETLIYCSHEYTQENAGFAIQIDPNNEALKARIEEINRLRADDIPTVPFTLATELATNPFLRADDAGIREQLGMKNAPEVEVFTEIRRRRG
ncbi:hydroxyacylglutathione hydrolase [Leucothrix pacifica]|uniref:Hydroxyacylglutathione hydrolase n=1 Tax=Leucothrix pacifica TaxID=1247513 RepID=A0A317CVR3_9GAMM|nr:hydroxyacylglutathione hydrolase [Leucothrix pacifica]PWR00443.1 hydroxyacylglutathione hydrolase [Leucothrix pacifica]